MPSSIKNHAVLWIAVILATALLLVAVLLPRVYGAEPLEWWNGVFQAGQLQQPKETLRSSDRTAKVIAHEDFKPDIAVLRICQQAPGWDAPNWTEPDLLRCNSNRNPRRTDGGLYDALTVHGEPETC